MALRAWPAEAASCPNTVSTTAGTTAGSLYYSLFTSECAELSPSLAGASINLSNGVTITGTAQVLLDTNGSSPNYTLAGSAIAGTGGLSFFSNPTGGTSQVLARVYLASGMNNTYTGATRVGPDVLLNLNTNTNLSSSSQIQLVDGSIGHAGLYLYNTVSSLANNIQLDSDGTTSGTSLGVITLNAITTLSGVVSQSSGVTGSVEIDTNSTVTLSAPGTFTGGLAISGTGALVLGGTAVQTAASSIYVPAGVYLNNASGTLASVISGSGGLTVSAGNATLSGINTYTGATVINATTALYLSGAGSIANSSSVTVAGGLYITDASSPVSISTLTSGGGVQLGSNKLIVTNASGTFSGVLLGTTSGATLEIAAGNQTLSNANQFSGSAIIDKGAFLTIAAGGNLGGSSVVADGTLVMNTSLTIPSLSGGASGAVSTGANTLTLSAANGVFNGTIQGSGQVTISAGGTEVFTGANSYLGGTVIGTGATLTVSGSTAKPGANLIANSGTLNLVNASTPITGVISGAGTYTDNGTLDISATTAGATVASVAGTGGVTLGAQTLTIANGNGNTLSGTITGTGGLVLAGGNETLSGANTYTGATTINSGATLTLSGSGSLVSSITDNGTLAFANVSSPYGKVIQGTGGVQVSAGTATLTAANTYTGNTTIDTGTTLALSGAGSISAGAVADNGLLDLSAASASSAVASISGTGGVNLGANNLTITAGNGGTLAGAITGTGGLIVAAGTQTLAGANSFSGPTSIHSGATLALTGVGSLGTSTVTDNGTLDISGTSTGATLSSLDGAGTVNLGARTLNLAAAQGNFSGALQGAGGGLTLAQGVQVLSGASTYTGTTLVQGGTLELASGASLASPVVVQSAGGLQAGNVNIAGSLSNDGVVRVGSTASPSQVLTVEGSYTQGANATLQLAIAPGSNTELKVNGPQLNLGGTLLVTAAAGNYLKTTYLLVDSPATTTLQGTFSNVVVSGLGSQYTYTITYIADPQVLLSIFVPSSFVNSATTGNTTQVATVLDGAIGWATGDLYQRLNDLYQLAPAQLAQAMDRLDGQLYAQQPQLLFTDVSWSWKQMFSRLNLSQQVDPAPHDGVFLLSSGLRQHQLGNGNADATHGSAGSMSLGLQGHSGAWDLGVLGGSLHIGSTRDLAGDSLSADLWRVGAFAGREVGPVRIGGLLGYAQGPLRTALAQRTARVWTAQGRAGRTLALGGGYSVTPLVGVDLQRLSLPAVTESDSLLGLSVPSQNQSSSSILTALRLDRAFERRGAEWIVSAGLGLHHWLKAPDSQLSLQFNGIPGSPFTASAVAQDRNVLQASLGLHAQLGQRLVLELSYQGQYGHSTRSNGLSARLGWHF